MVACALGYQVVCGCLGVGGEVGPPTPLGRHSEQDKREGQQDRSGEGTALISKCYNHTAVDRPAGA